MSKNTKRNYLTLPRIEKIPKKVYQDNFQDFCKIRNCHELILELYAIATSIEAGDGVPEKYYRSGIDKDHDDLLATTGVMHLHLGGKGSDTLLYLVQFSDKVIFLETNTHKHLRGQPKGKNILAFMQPWFKRLIQPCFLPLLLFFIHMPYV